MTLSGSFLAVAGTVTGRDHRRAERDGQDGHALVATDEVVAAIVTDGCSSGCGSEIGARVGAAWLAALVEQRFRGTGHAAADVVADAAAAAVAAAADVTRLLLARLELLARSFDAAGDVRAAHVDASLLFGFLAAVVTPITTLVFGVGDGIVIAEGRVTVLDPGPDNAPPYVAYGLVGGSRACVEPRIHFVGPTANVEVIAVATDGAAPLVHPRAASLDALPALHALAADPRYAKNASLLRKRLVVLSDRGTFSDDVTLGVVQRRRA